MEIILILAQTAMLQRQSRKAYLLISRHLTSGQCQTDVHPEYKPSQNPGQNSCELPRNSDDLACYLSKRVVAMSDHFVVLDKPPNLSVFGHALAKQEALSLIDPQTIPLANLCIHDCLPQLAQLLARENPSPDHWTPLQPVFYQTSKRSKPLSNQLPQLLIIEPLPAAYSGLILLGRTSEYAQAGRKFYTTAMQGNPPWAMYQKFLALCWGQPVRKCAQMPKFPIASYPLNKHINIGYRPSAEEITTNRMKKGEILYKRIQHKLVTQAKPHASLIELTMNSTYRGLPEVYLLLEGCSILGETLQSSRLVRTGLTPVILHPSQTQLNAPIPSSIRQHLGNLNLKPEHMPIHLHRTSLWIPGPIYEPSSKTHLVKPYASQPHGQFVNIRSSQSTDSSTSTDLAIKPVPQSLSWSQIPTNPDSTGYVLTCHSLDLPSYFQNSLNKFGMDFDYVDWISKQT